MKTCKGLQAINFLTKVLLLVTIYSSSLKQQLVSASHLHISTNYANTEGEAASSSTSTTTTTTDAPPDITTTAAAEAETAQQNVLSSSTTTATATATTKTNSTKKYSSIKAECDEKFMTITGRFHDLFRGRIYAFGYPDEIECGVMTVGNEASENVTFVLPLGQCGVQMRALDDDLEKDLLHDVTVYIQYSAYLQQIIDEKLSLSCVEARQKPVAPEDVEQALTDGGIGRNSRQGRRLKDPGVKSGLPKIGTKIGEAWMEIIGGKDPTPKSKKYHPIAVGEDVTLVVSTKVNRGYDARIVNCTAHDGSRTGQDGYRAQQILDSAGCSVDKALVPNFRRRRLPVETRNRLSTLHFATFPAFKFPERDHLHVKCSVAYCQGPCPQEACDSGRNHFGSWREKYGRIAEVLMETSDIVNSLEVLAPELEDTGGHHYERHQSGGALPTSDSSSSSSAASLSSSSSSSSSSNNLAGGTSRQFSDSQQLFYTSGSGGGGGNNGNGPPQSIWTTTSTSNSNNNNQIPQGQGQQQANNHANVCISPFVIILTLVILGMVLVISATATLWFALKRSELKKLQMKHAFHHSPSPYYRFSQHW